MENTIFSALKQFRGWKININPGFVRTLIFQRNGVPNSQEVVELQALKSSLRRIGLPNEVSPVLKYLASDAAAHITGANFAIDGGITNYSPLLDLDEAMMLSI
ncbi:enoyl-(Acyl carrier protein) reductase domain-containing protein [Ditylenchus destructor]|uniref:Peroxisomal trans-2-enoyl-CoA reductase n=1 Tax=Ditylenchus destructor TaxID=166010 RepID=A0AAD4QX89_9BILA|nr:enoyl-(Acyl carrier protein) reductase domain-containing protein [Ditylenchus destructor]